MTLEDFIRIYNLPPTVPLKRAYELTNLRHTTIYNKHKRGEIQILKNGSRSGLAVETVYRLACQLPPFERGGTVG